MTSDSTIFIYLHIKVKKKDVTVGTNTCTKVKRYFIKLTINIKIFYIDKDPKVIVKFKTTHDRVIVTIFTAECRDMRCRHRSHVVGKLLVRRLKTRVLPSSKTLVIG